MLQPLQWVNSNCLLNSCTPVFPVATERNENGRCKRKDCSNIQTRDMMSNQLSYYH